ncbi:hypothetical protein [Paenibacillus sp. NRS-1760]|uniref:hypothetical protein n=1 Tax=Paenibacillus sp. NRS-1760 TaxID=3233902 RepID=UPI003D2A074D
MSKKKSSIPEQLIYVGPTLPGGRLAQYSIFRGGVPDHLQDLITNHLEINDLIVSVATFHLAQAATQEVGTTEYSAYKALSQLSR